MNPSGRISESLLSRSSTVLSSRLTPFQNQIDALTTGFVEKATDVKILSSLVAGGFASRLGKIGTVTAGMGIVPALPLRVASTAAGFAVEITAFETSQRLLSSPSSPNLWKWEGYNGFKQGLLSSSVNFGLLKGTGRLALGQNLILQHFFQDAAMVTGHRALGALGILPAPEGDLLQQLVHAEALNLQIGAGMVLVHSSFPNILTLERDMDFALRTHDSKGRGAGDIPSFFSSPRWVLEAPFQGLAQNRSGKSQAELLNLLSSGGKEDGPSNLSKLIEDLAHSDKNIRKAAVEALGEIDSPHARESLVASLSHPDPTVRRTAIEIVGKKGLKEALSPLLKILEDENTGWEELTLVIQALGDLRDPVSVEPLLKKMDRPHKGLREEIIRALRRIDSPEIAGRLIPFMQSLDVDVSIEAIKALSDFQSPETARILLRYIQIHPQIIRQLRESGKDDGHPDFIKTTLKLANALWALEQFDANITAPILIEMLRDNESTNFARVMLWSLGEKVAGLLYQARNHKDPLVREAIAAILEQIGN